MDHMLAPVAEIPTRSLSIADRGRKPTTQPPNVTAPVESSNYKKVVTLLHPPPASINPLMQ